MAQCAVCPQLALHLDEVLSVMKQDTSRLPELKLSLESHMQDLKSDAEEKKRLAASAKTDERTAKEEKNEAERKLEESREAEIDAHIDFLWKSKEMKKIKVASQAASQATEEAVKAALEDKEIGCGKATENAIAAGRAFLIAEHDHVKAKKAQALAEIEKRLAEEEAQKAIALLDKAVAKFEDTKTCATQSKYDLDTRTVEKSWATEGAQTLMAQTDENIAKRKARKADAEAKAASLTQAAAYAVEDAESALSRVREKLSNIEREACIAISIAEDAATYRQATVDRAVEISAYAKSKSKHLERVILYLETTNKTKLSEMLGDTSELVPWDVKAGQILEERLCTIEEEVKLSQPTDAEKEKYAIDILVADNAECEPPPPLSPPLPITDYPGEFVIGDESKNAELPYSDEQSWACITAIKKDWEASLSHLLRPFNFHGEKSEEEI